MKGATDFTPATLDQRLANAPADLYKSEPALPPFNLQVKAFASNPALSAFRIFSNQVSLGQMVNGRIVPLTSTFVPADQKASLKGTP
jgi:hypothetical protein